MGSMAHGNTKGRDCAETVWKRDRALSLRSPSGPSCRVGARSPTGWENYAGTASHGLPRASPKVRGTSGLSNQPLSVLLPKATVTRNTDRPQVLPPTNPGTLHTLLLGAAGHSFAEAHNDDLVFPGYILLSKSELQGHEQKLLSLKSQDANQ